MKPEKNCYWHDNSYNNTNSCQNLFFDKNSKNQKDYFEVIIQNVNQCEKCSTDSPLKINEAFLVKFIKIPKIRRDILKS